jgi:Tol biopolymer transport system component/predicted Ser/Thr protein kinase
MPAGDKLGPYEVLARIGKGGMGEVYRAHDPRLRRDVAIKISSQRFDERFEREARAIAALNHPNICQIYDVGPDYLVMELVEGPTLKERIEEAVIPLDEALRIAEQIAGALAAAHEKFITHRDLKPGNVKIKDDGTVKVLDFGLAKVGGMAPTRESEDSPTFSMTLTQTGVILGTAAYMSPEQARGKPVDARSDIWAFGVVLYEILTGKRLFRGDDLTEILASVVKDQPDLGAAPQPVRKLLEACLQKDPNKRLQAVGDVRFLLESGLEPARGFRLAPWVAGALAVAFAALAYLHFRETPATEGSLRLSVSLPDSATPGFLELSPDGQRLAMVLVRPGSTQLYVRSLDSGELQPLSGTELARTPFWSPDGRFLAFFAESRLKVVPAAGGPARVLCGETGLGSGGTWSRNGVILFGDDHGLRRVNADRANADEGAKGEQCSAVGNSDPPGGAAVPVFLPDANHFFYVRQGMDETTRGVFLASLDEPAGHKILDDVSSVVYTPPSSSGSRSHLLFLRENTLMAQPFDDSNLRPVGDPFTVASRASTSPTQPQVGASASADGTLVYLSGRSRETQLTWFDRTGKELGKVGPSANQSGLALSPDGNTVAILRRDANNAPSVWLHDLTRDSESRLAPNSGGRLWSPDSSRFWFSMAGPEGPGIYQQDLKAGRAELLIANPGGANAFNASDWSRDGRFVLYTAIDPKTRADIWYLPLDSRKPDLQKAKKFMATDAIESQGQFSPDGKWVAFSSDETGKGNIYIRSFPNGSLVWKVSVDGGRDPRWRSDGKELYFVNIVVSNRSSLFSVSVESDGRGGLRIGSPTKLFDVQAPVTVPQLNVWMYSPHPDKQRFLVNVQAGADQPTVNVITHWRKATKH